MANRNSRASQKAMKDMDHHASAEPSGMRMEEKGNETMRAHTKPAGDMRKIEMMEESNRRISRADQMRSGNKTR